MSNVKHLSMAELEARLGEIRGSPKDNGILELIVRRPQANEREVLQEAQLNTIEGLVGDNWRFRKNSRTPNGHPHPDTQLNIMNARVIALMAQDKDRWQLAGDQLFINMDLGVENLPPGSQLLLGSAVIQVTDKPHNGCKKFVARYGLDAMKFVNSSLGKQLHLRGINAKVIQSGTIRVGDVVKKILK